MSDGAHVLEPPFTTVSWSADGRSLRLLDQRLLPSVERYFETRAVQDTVDAIRTLAVRGAPAIGVAAAIGLVVALEHSVEQVASLAGGGSRATAAVTRSVARRTLPHLAQMLDASRPTAVNLRWALQRMLRVAETLPEDRLMSGLRAEATHILEEDRAMCLAIGEAGAPFIAEGAGVLTHCNAGALATAGIGTALAPMYVAHARGVKFAVFADETRPLLQGARLTSWELHRAGINVTVQPDGAAASLLRSGAVQAVFVGADRIAANGDVANKVGTYPLALAAHAHGVPFHVCAPYSTFDVNTPSGDDIEIEHRHRDELAFAGEREVLPAHVRVNNPAFDVTPRALITQYITERGVLSPPFHI
jgi:methylthioribose-1-phosphate isomerase